jgi:hypothetical protein
MKGFVKGVTMRKTTILLFIGITSLIIMSCSLGGIAQIAIDSEPTDDDTTNHSTAVVESLPIDNQEQAITAEKTPTATVDHLLESKSCLAKTWEIKGLSDYVLASVPPELAEEYSLEYIDTTGAAYLKLSNDEKMELQINKLEILFNARLAIFEVPVTVRIDGIAGGTYQVEKNTLHFININTSGLTASAKALDEDVMEPDQIINAIPFVRPPYNTATYSCQGDVLTLNLSGYPDNTPPLVFQAVR